MDNEVLITVDTPVTVTPESGRKYTSYLITIQTRNIAFSLHNSKVRRRFSEFVWLKSWLSKYYTETRVPDLPPKKYFGQQFHQSVIEERCFGLKKFLQEVVIITQYLSDSSVHLFLQSQLNVDDIIATVEGKSGKSVLETIVEAGNLLESSVDSGLAPAEGSSGQRHPTHLDLSNCMPSLPRHMIFSPTRPDSPILSFIPGSSSDSPGESQQTSSTSQTGTDFNDSGNVSNVSVEDGGSDPKMPCSLISQEESANKAEEMQTRKVTSCTEIVVVSSQITT